MIHTYTQYQKKAHKLVCKNNKKNTQKIRISHSKTKKLIHIYPETHLEKYENSNTNTHYLQTLKHSHTYSQAHTCTDTQTNTDKYTHT